MTLQSMWENYILNTIIIWVIKLKYVLVSTLHQILLLSRLHQGEWDEQDGTSSTRGVNIKTSEEEIVWET
jgi:hypothetical protein